jgi:hypothetical protein
MSMHGHPCRQPTHGNVTGGSRSALLTCHQQEPQPEPEPEPEPELELEPEPSRWLSLKVWRGNEYSVVNWTAGHDLPLPLLLLLRYLPRHRSHQ